MVALFRKRRLAGVCQGASHRRPSFSFPGLRDDREFDTFDRAPSSILVASEDVLPVSSSCNVAATPRPFDSIDVGRYLRVLFIRTSLRSSPQPRLDGLRRLVAGGTALLDEVTSD